MSEAEGKPRKRMGRPPKAPEKGRRQNYTFRMSDSTRDQVISAAEQSGRSISEEIERRVEESLLQRNIIDHLSAYINSGADLIFGGRHNIALFIKLSDHIFFAEQATKKSWINDVETRKRVAEDVSKALPGELDNIKTPLLSLTDRINKRNEERAEIRSRIADDDD